MSAQKNFKLDEQIILDVIIMKYFPVLDVVWHLFTV